MRRKKFLIVGGGGRESIFAQKLMEDTVLYAVISHENPTITSCVSQSGGTYLTGNVNDPQVVLAFAKKHQIDYAFINADEPLANGIVDVLLDNNIKAIGGTQAATKIEWDKVYAMNLMQRVCAEYTPYYEVVSQVSELSKAIDTFKSKEIELVVKPQGLTGGKGVKVMPDHLKTYEEAISYAVYLLSTKPNEKVLLVEKLHGIEFTIMGITDGDHIVLAPATYDYPFRFENDLGAGTGGMGCFAGMGSKLPFMTEKDLAACKYIMQRIIDAMKDENLIFNGVLNGGFFKTSQGIKFMEFNSRFGDPEALNILSVLKGSFSELLVNIYKKQLTDKKVSFLPKASVVKYLVAKEYPSASKDIISFKVEEEAMKAKGMDIFYAACIQTEKNTFETLKKSRVMAVVAISDKIEAASENINDAIEQYIHGNLAYRKDIGSVNSLKKLGKIMVEHK